MYGTVQGLFCNKFSISKYIITSLEIVNSIAKNTLSAVGVQSWWRHQMETFSALLAICAGNSPVPGEFPTQRPVTRSFVFFFDLRRIKGLNKQSWGWWSETRSRPLWRHSNVLHHTVWTVHHYKALICWARIIRPFLSNLHEKIFSLK